LIPIYLTISGDFNWHFSHNQTASSHLNMIKLFFYCWKCCFFAYKKPADDCYFVADASNSGRSVIFYLFVLLLLKSSVSQRQYIITGMFIHFQQLYVLLQK
jgi:hypothetical protein